MEHPNFLLNLQIVDICEFLRGYLADRYDEIQLAGFYLQADIPEEPIYVNLDGPQFRRALDNILYNSVKYNSLGTVLAVGIEKNEKNSKSVGIYIADNGIGVSPDQRETIFQPFVMGDESRSGGGSGLGLAISKRIVESHGGSIGLQPVTDGGFSTVFKIILQTEAEKKEEIIKDL